jgi:hypothetical protein
LGYQIKDKEMDRACSVNVVNGRELKIFFQKSARKRPFKKP